MDKVKRDKSPKARGRKPKRSLPPGPGGEIAGDDGCVIPAPKAGETKQLIVGFKYGPAQETIEGPVTIAASACTLVCMKMGDQIHVEAGQSAFIYVSGAQLHLTTKHLESGWNGKREVSLATGPHDAQIIVNIIRK